jgi:hypothetical protein
VSLCEDRRTRRQLSHLAAHCRVLAGDATRRPLRPWPDSRPQNPAHDPTLRAPLAGLYGRSGGQAGRRHDRDALPRKIGDTWWLPNRVVRKGRQLFGLKLIRFNRSAWTPDLSASPSPSGIGAGERQTMDTASISFRCTWPQMAHFRLRRSRLTCASNFIPWLILILWSK